MMSTVLPKKVKCSMCGTTNQFMVLASTNTFGPTDLDTRPPQMKRSTMGYWLQSCPVCGYVAGEISKKSRIGRAFLESDAYKTCDGVQFVSELAKKFYRHYLMMVEKRDTDSAFWDLLHVSWACDDANDEENASAVRRKAIDIAAELLQEKDYDMKETVSLILADMMRRISLFDELLETFGQVKYEKDLLNQIIEFEKELARRKCTKCLTVRDAIDFAEGNFDWSSLDR